MAESSARPLKVEEVEDKIHDLLQNKAEIAKICYAFRLLGSHARCGWSPQDVFQQVALDSLTGVRTWKAEISTFRHFEQNGRSIIHRESERHGVSMTDALEKDDTGHTSPSAQALYSQPVTTPEGEVIQDEQERTLSAHVRKVLALFSEDRQALCYLKHCLEQSDVKSAIIQYCRFSEKVYRNVRQRIKDKVRKRFPAGIDWWELSK